MTEFVSRKAVKKHGYLFLFLLNFILFGCSGSNSEVNNSEKEKLTSLSESISVTDIRLEEQSSDEKSSETTSSTNSESISEVSLEEDKNSSGYVTVSAVLPEDYPQEVKSYTCSVFHPDEQNMASVFLDTEDYNVEEWALGNLYITDKAGIYPYYAKQGSHYIRTDFSAENYLYVIRESRFLPACFSSDDTLGQIPLKEGVEDRLLTFDITKDEAELKEKLTACGFPELRLKSVSCWDAETLNENRTIVQDALLNLQEGLSQDRWKIDFSETEAALQYEYTQDDELAYMIFEQCVDGIPLTMDYWGAGDGSIAGRTFAQALFTKEGLAELSSERICHIESENGMISVMSPEKAISIFTEIYNQKKSFCYTEIVEIELQYILCGKELGESDTGLYLRPVWMIRTQTERDPSVYAISDYAAWDVYEHGACCISADTGVILQSSADER